MLRGLVAALVSASFVVTPALAAPPKKADPPKWDVNAPPGPFKDVPIDTTTGTWMSVDVSPDGKEVLFDLLGDLYTVPIGGGEARRARSQGLVARKVRAASAPLTRCTRWPPDSKRSRPYAPSPSMRSTTSL